MRHNQLYLAVLLACMAIGVTGAQAIKPVPCGNIFKAGYCTAVAIYKLPTVLQPAQVGDETIRCDASK